MLKILEPHNSIKERAPNSIGDGRVTVIVPAYNEAESIKDTIYSLQSQTLIPHKIIVVDDCSTDGTGDLARSLGVEVIRPPTNTGSKAGAQTYALTFVETEFTIATDADTILDENAINLLVTEISRSDIAAACGFVIPRYVKSIWERGRYTEYLFAFTFFKQIQDHFGRPLISSGCFSIYRTDVLRSMGGWSNRTLAEDMDLTWSFYAAGHGVRFVPEAVCYPIEPNDLRFLKQQLRRWSHGFWQNIRLHWREIVEQPYLRSTITVMLWDALVVGSIWLFIVPILAILITPAFLLLYVIDLPIIAVPVLFAARERRELGLAITSLPAYPVLRIVNSVMVLRAFWLEFVMKRPLRVYEKGH